MRDPKIMKTNYRQELWETAVNNFGYVTTQDAIDLGVPPKELSKLAEHGGLDHVTYGLYRFRQFPQTNFDQYAEAVLRVGTGAYLTGDTVLIFHNLIPLAPKRLRVGVRRRVRAKIPDWIDVRQESVSESDITAYEGIPAKKVARAIVECMHTMMGTRLIEATKAAQTQGLITSREAIEILNELDGVR